MTTATGRGAVIHGREGHGRGCRRGGSGHRRAAGGGSGRRRAAGSGSGRGRRRAADPGTGGRSRTPAAIRRRQIGGAWPVVTGELHASCREEARPHERILSSVHAFGSDLNHFCSGLRWRLRRGSVQRRWRPAGLGSSVVEAEAVEA
uniref:Uncharacterized protein n=1 Tax=Oryza glumipatula TaxID=40148 RepID=A0A0D9YAT7_9ORYZ